MRVKELRFTRKELIWLPFLVAITAGKYERNGKAPEEEAESFYQMVIGFYSALRSFKLLWRTERSQTAGLFKA